MGFDFCCGCRISGGHWFLCPSHESYFIKKLIPYQDENFCLHYNISNSSCFKHLEPCQFNCNHYKNKLAFNHRLIKKTKDTIKDLHD